MSCFRIPHSICEGIDRECSRFWWGSNKALLAKQIWRIIWNPQSLVARVLKARYFKHDGVMKAPLEVTRCIYGDPSLLWSRSLLEEGLYWRFGNGNSIQDRWMPKLRDLIVNHGSPELNQNHVRALIKDGKWDEVVDRDTLIACYLMWWMRSLAFPSRTTRYNILDFESLKLKGKYFVREGYNAGIGLHYPPENQTDSLV